MTTDSKDQVSFDALLRSYAVPNTWVITFGWGRDWWFNQENGMRTDPQLPTRVDVERWLTP